MVLSRYRSHKYACQCTSTWPFANEFSIWEIQIKMSLTYPKYFTDCIRWERKCDCSYILPKHPLNAKWLGSLVTTQRQNQLGSGFGGIWTLKCRLITARRAEIPHSNGTPLPIPLRISRAGVHKEAFHSPPPEEDCVAQRAAGAAGSAGEWLRLERGRAPV